MPRRIIPIIIPLVIYPSLLLLKIGGKKVFNDLKEKLQLIDLFIPWFLSVSVLVNYFFALSHSSFDSLHKIFVFKVMPSKIELITLLIKNSGFIIVGLMLLGCTMWFVHYYLKNKNIQKRSFKNWSMFCLTTLITLGFVKTIYLFFIDYHYKLSPLWIVGVSLVLSYLIYRMIFEDSSLLTTRTLKIYIIYCIVVIVLFSVVFPSFSVKNASLKVADLTDKGDAIVGWFSHGLSIESGTRPLFYKFQSPFKDFIDYDIFEKHQPKLYLTLVNRIGVPPKEDVPNELTYIETVELNKIFGIGRPWSVVEIYKIEYKE